RILVDSAEIGSNPGDNQPPTISAINDQAANEDTAVGPIGFTVADSQTPPASLVVTGSSSNPSLLPNSNITFGGSGSNRTVTLSPAPNQFGTATVTITASDGSLSATRSFGLTVNSVNDPPTISTILNQLTDEDTPLGPISLTLGDVDSPPARLALSAISSNPALIPDENVIFGGSNLSRTMMLLPASNPFGSATITVSVSDGADAASTTFILTVRPVNDPPTISPIADQTIDEDAPVGPLTFSIGDIETAASDLTLSGFSSNPL